MAVAAAFPSVAREHHLQKIRNTGLNEYLARWTDSFMRNRRIMSTDGERDEVCEVTTDPPRHKCGRSQQAVRGCPAAVGF